jgi:hypothetical protein
LYKSVCEFEYLSLVGISGEAMPTLFKLGAFFWNLEGKRSGAQA